MHELKPDIIEKFKRNYHTISERQNLWNTSIREEISDWIKEFIKYNISQGNFQADEFQLKSGGEQNSDFVGIHQVNRPVDIIWDEHLCTLDGGYLNFYINARGNLSILIGRPFVERIEWYEDGREIAFHEEVDMREWKMENLINYFNKFFEVLNEYYNISTQPKPIGFRMDP